MSHTVKVPPIEESIDLTDPYRSVTERYYTPFYNLDPDRTKREDYCVLFHSNRICLITLAPSHPILANKLKILGVDCEINKNTDRKKNKALGKSKKGGQKLDEWSVVCYLQTADKSYPVRATTPGKLITLNRSVLQNPELIESDPYAEGHIAIILPFLGQLDTCKKKLLSQSDYDKQILSETS